jgi:transcriptional regulator with XRE-family HTH domain/quercetin dioxygenase-like cupin family protein
MPASDVRWLGVRLRAERMRRGISLRSLARDVGVSASMISQIETGKSRPSVSTLYAITSALGISIEDVFSAPPPATESMLGDLRAVPDLATSDRRGTDRAGTDRASTGAAVDALTGSGPPTTVIEVLDAMRGRRRGPLVRSDQRQVLTLDSGVTWELLGELPPYPVDFMLVTYAPGGTSSSTGGLMRHSGSEFGFLLSGELTLTLGFDEIALHPGDSISFESTTPHGYRNDGTEPAVGVWFVIERSQ